MTVGGGKFAPCDLEIQTTDGRRISHHVEYTPGTPHNPVSLDDLKAKFRDCVASGIRPMSTAQCETAIETVLAIDELDNMKGVFDFATR